MAARRLRVVRETSEYERIGYRRISPVLYGDGQFRAKGQALPLLSTTARLKAPTGLKRQCRLFGHAASYGSLPDNCRFRDVIAWLSSTTADATGNVRGALPSGGRRDGNATQKPPSAVWSVPGGCRKRSNDLAQHLAAATWRRTDALTSE